MKTRHFIFCPGCNRVTESKNLILRGAREATFMCLEETKKTKPDDAVVTHILRWVGSTVRDDNHIVFWA